MSKKRTKPIIPPLQIDPVQERNTKALLARMRGESGTPEAGMPALPNVPLPSTPEAETLILPNSEGIATPESGLHLLPNKQSNTPENDILALPNILLPSTPEPPSIGSRTRREQVNTPEPKRVKKVNTPERISVGSAKSKERYEAWRLENEAKVNFSIPDEKHRENKAFAARLGVSLKDLYVLAVDHLKECRECRGPESSGVNTAHDDLKIYKTHEDIIMLYKSYTGNAWKPGDDKAAQQFNQSDRRKIEIGILASLINTKYKKINGFAYFNSEIEHYEDECRELKISDGMIDGVLRRRREQWEKKKNGNTVG